MTHMLSLGSFATKIFGSANERKIKGLRPKVEAINALEAEVAKLSDDQLRARTAEFRQQLENRASVDDLLVPAFATVREAAKRTIKQRHFDVQLIGGMVLHQGKIAEMKTGEGKTLVASLPLYLNALSGRGAHLVTVNDYLARRDAGWMGPVFHLLGLSVGVVVPGPPMQPPTGFVYDPEVLDETHPDPRLQHFRQVSRREAYECDITYGTNNEFGFDYLRDNMATELAQQSQR